MRRIPATIASQHPDNAGAPYWDKAERPFISVYQEIHEAVTCFQDLGVSEYMWDWEGKHADAAVIDRLFSDYHDYFAKQQLGRDKFLTFRIPNIWEEKGYNLLQAMTVILSSEDFARDLKFHDRPLFEVILPMTERADQLIRMQELFEKLAQFKSTQFTPDQPPNDDYLEIIPLVESVESQLGVADLLTDYVKLHKRHFGRNPDYIRAFLACSDSTLSSGLLAGLIANKIALSRLYEFSGQTGIPIFPFMGPGSLKFRGGLSPDSIDRFLEEFPGVRTVTVQSAFRYDYPKPEVKTAIAKLERELPKSKPRLISLNKQKRLIDIANQSAKFYQQTISGIAGDMQKYFNLVPKRRDRRLHIGLQAYSRSMGEQTLPRAITFTAAFYSIGVPPEFIGMGRTLRWLKPSDLKLLKSEYPNLTKDFEAIGRYLNPDNLEILASQNNAWKKIQTDIAAVAEILDLTFEPKTKAETAHQKLSSKLFQTKKTTEMTLLITQMATLRKSLG
jgi:phosphoenolpyruvate carboxylase